MKIFKAVHLLGSILLLTLAIISCANDKGSETLEKVVFMAGFKAQANLPFVAVYVAQEKGFFKNQGLEVEIRHSGKGQHLSLLMAKEVDITTAAATSVLKRRSDPDLPIVAFALFGQKGQQAYVALKNSGIENLSDWEGKTFGYKISPPADYMAMLKANNIDRSKITEVNAGFDPRILTEGRVDILAVFKSNEPDTIRNLGFEVNIWDPKDYGVNSLGLTYITRQELAQSDPELIEKFLKATMKATEYIFDHKDEALDIVMEYASSEQRDHQSFMLQTELLDAIGPITDQHGIGWMTDAQWESLYLQLIEFEALSNPFDYKTAYTNDFLKTVYDGTELRWP